jgi:hypothetical protein
MGNQQPKNVGETSSNNIIDIHYTIENDLIYKKVDDTLVMSEYVKFITSMVQNNDFKSVCSALTQGSYINCLYYSLISFYKIKDNHNIEIYFFSGKYYKVEFNSSSIRKLSEPEIYVFPFIKYTFNQKIIEYTIWDETLTHLIPIFL